MSNTYFKDRIPPIAYQPVYHPAYKILGKDRYGNTCAVLIKRRDVAQTEVELRGLTNDAITINTSFADKDFFRPVMGTECTVEVVTKVYNLLFPLMNADDTRFLFEVYENYDTEQENMIFTGFYRSDSFRQTWRKPNAYVSLSATSGMGLLRYIKFNPVPQPGYVSDDNQGPIQGLHKMSYVLSYLFYLAGNRSEWYDMVPYFWGPPRGRTRGDMTEQEKGFMEEPVQVAELYEKSCLEVLEHIMAYNDTQVIMVNGKIAVRMMDDPATDHYRVYDHRGDYVNNIDPLGNILDTNPHFYNINGSIVAESDYKRLIIEKKYIPTENFLYNYNFMYEAAGWSKSSSAPENNFWEVFGDPYNFMTMSTVAWNELNAYIRSDLDRGHPQLQQQGTRYQVMMEVSWIPAFDNEMPESGVGLKVGLGTENETYVVKPAEWNNMPVTVTYDFYMSNAPDELRIYAVRELEGGELENGKLVVQNIRVHAMVFNIVNREFVTIRGKTDEKIIEVNDKSIRDTVRSISHFEGNQYAYLNRTPRANITRREGGMALVSEWKIQRYIDYHTGARKRLTINSIVKNNVSVSGLSLIRDVELNTTFVVSSIKYNPVRKSISLDLIGYKDYLIDLPEDPDLNPLWILATGEWNDDGVWVDDETWKDN